MSQKDYAKRRMKAVPSGNEEYLCLPSSRTEAQLSGASRYFTGKACKHGHVGLRYTGTAACHTCEVARSADPEFRKRKNSAAREYARKRGRNPEFRARRSMAAKEAWKDPSFQESRRRYWRKRYRSDPEFRAKGRARFQRYRTSKLNATPQWLTDEQHAQIDEVFCESEHLNLTTNIPHNVDHIIPLQHPDVCGLHVPWNLQVLTEYENKSKGNKFDFSMTNDGWRDTQ